MTASRPGEPTPGSTEPPEIQLRPLRTQRELHACVRLQKETWGESFGESVPPSILKVCQRVGGVAAGAFDERDELIGFVFGLTGVEPGRIVHWSDMLAVRRGSRGLGVGRRLKEFQRELLLPLGVEVIYWTYDPLVARNAHLNLGRLGAEVVEYAEDMYGESESELHRGLGTDRLVVAWRIREGSAPLAPPVDPRAAAGAPVAGSAAEPADGAPLVRVEVPADIEAVQRESLEEAARWRRVTREAFLAWMGRGYRVVGFLREPGSGRCFYLLRHP